MKRFGFRLFGVILAAAGLETIGAGALNAEAPPATQVVVTPATGPGSATAPAVIEAGQLIKQLGSDVPEERDAAQKQLVNLGEPVIPALKKAAEEDDDAEVRSRASAALLQMKDHSENDTTLVSLHRKDAPAQEVMDAIGTQAHAQFIGYGTSALAPGVAARTLTVDADHKPFWDVMTDVCAQMNVCPVLDSPGKNSMRLFPVVRNWITQSPHQIVGPYWVGVAGLYRARSVDLTGPQTVDDQFSIRLIVYPEPKLAVTQISELKLKEVTDDAGNSLMPKPQAPGMTNMLRAGRQVNHMIEARLSYPQRPGNRISVLSAEVVVLLAQGLQRYEVDDVMGTQKVTNPLTHCTVKTAVARQGTEMFRVTLECTRDGLSDDKWSAMINRMGDMSMEDADGHALVPLGTVLTTMQSDTAFTGTCLFSRSQVGFGMLRGMQPAQPVAKTGDAKRLTWNVATSLKPVTIPVLFKDLPMP